MRTTPPPGSKISLTTFGGDDVIRIPQASAGLARYLYGAFIVFWLGAWTVGFSSAFSKVSAGNAPAFLIFWLAAWTIGGVLAALMVYRIFRPAVPESVRLGVGGIVYDSGIPAFRMQRYSSQWASWGAMFPKRTVVEVDRQQLKSLRLRETDTGNRLTLDVASQRIELGQAASEVEREWLFQILSGRYR
jgi:hypothetical protein